MSFKAGMKAFRRPEKQGKHWFIQVNPHPEGTSKHKEWELGFNKAYFQNLARVQQHEQHPARS